MAFDPLYSAMKLARSPGFSGAGLKQTYRPSPRFGGPIQKASGGSVNPAGLKQPPTPSPTMGGSGKYAPKGRPITTRPGGGFSNQPYRF